MAPGMHLSYLLGQTWAVMRFLLESGKARRWLRRAMWSTQGVGGRDTASICWPHIWLHTECSAVTGGAEHRDRGEKRRPLKDLCKASTKEVKETAQCAALTREHPIKYNLGVPHKPQGDREQRGACLEW